MTVSLLRQIVKNIPLIPSTICLIYLLIFVLIDPLTITPEYVPAFLFVFLLSILLSIPMMGILFGFGRWAEATFAIVIYLIISNTTLALAVIDAAQLLATILSPIVPAVVATFGVPLGILYVWQKRHIVANEEFPKSDGLNLKTYQGQSDLATNARSVTQLLKPKLRRKLEKAGGQRLNGILIIGRMGADKTYLARTIAGEAGVPFFYVDVSSLRSVFWVIARGEITRIYREARTQSRFYGGAVVCLANLDLVKLDDQITTQHDKGEVVLDNLLANSDAGLVNAIKVEMSAYHSEKSAWMRFKVWLSHKVFRGGVPRAPYVLTIGEITDLEMFPHSLQSSTYFAEALHIPELNEIDKVRFIQNCLLTIAHDKTVEAVILAQYVPDPSPDGVRAWLNIGLRRAFSEGRGCLSLSDFDIPNLISSKVENPSKSASVEGG